MYRRFLFPEMLGVAIGQGAELRYCVGRLSVVTQWPRKCVRGNFQKYNQQQSHRRIGKPSSPLHSPPMAKLLPEAGEGNASGGAIAVRMRHAVGEGLFGVCATRILYC